MEFKVLGVFQSFMTFFILSGPRVGIRVQGWGIRVQGYKGVLEVFDFLFLDFEWTYPPILRVQDSNGVVGNLYKFFICEIWKL